VKDARERARFVRENQLFTRFEEGLQMFDGKGAFTDLVDLLDKYKVYFSKLSADCKFIKSAVRPGTRGFEGLVQERLSFLNLLARFILASYVCLLSQAIEMVPFELFQIKQAILDVLEYYHSALDKYGILLPDKKLKKAPKSLSVPDSNPDRQAVHRRAGEPPHLEVSVSRELEEAAGRLLRTRRTVAAPALQSEPLQRRPALPQVQRCTREASRSRFRAPNICVE
jgi:hypothetical protein